MALIAIGVGLYTIAPWPASPPASPPPSSPHGQTAASDMAWLADMVAGTYVGDVIADSKGGSRSDVVLTVTKLDRSTVRVTSEYGRMGTVDVTLTRIGNQILNADGDTPFMLDLERNPPALVYDPHSELAYRGNKRP